MSWNPSMLKEAYKDGPWVIVTRKKTGKRVKVVFSAEEPMEVISPHLFARGEILIDAVGTKVRTLGVTGYGMQTWSYKSYAVEVLPPPKAKR